MMHIPSTPLRFAILGTALGSLCLLAGCTAVPSAPSAATSSEVARAADGELQDAPHNAPLPFDPTLRHGRLDNGLTYYVRHHRQPENRAELRLVVNAGSMQEEEDQRGLAHFVEHMAFNGTRNFERQEIVDYLETIGMRFGADINASTSFDETIYALTVPTDDHEILDQAFRIFEDWAHNVLFDPEEIERERGVVIEEWRLGRGATARLRDEQFPILFRDSRYAERLPIGKKKIIENAPPETLERFYRDWYRPDLMAVVAVGDFDAARIEKLIRRRFGRLPKTKDPLPRESHPVPGHEETLWSFKTDPELPRTTISIYTKLPPTEEGSFGAYRQSLVEGLYHGLLNARLGEIAQLPDPPFLFGFASAADLVRSRKVYIQTAAVSEGGVERGLGALLEESERADRHGFNASELERAKKNLERAYEQAFRERDKVAAAALAAECGRHFLTGESIPGLVAELELVRRFLPEITLEEVNELARDFITEKNRVILVNGPEKEGAELPSQKKLEAVFASVKEQQIEPWVDRTLDEPLVATAPEPGAVVEESTIPEVGVTEWRLANGARVVLKPTEFRNDQILLSASSPGGHSLVAQRDHTSASFATSIVGESGYGNFNSIELGKALAGQVAGGSPYISELEEGFSGAASPEDLETLFQLVYLAFTAPRYDSEAFASLENRWRILLENRRSQPEAAFADELNRVLTQDHPRHRPISPEVLAEIDPERALEIYRERFADASDFTFVLVGNFEPATIRPLVEVWLGGLPVREREENWRDVAPDLPAGVERVEVRKGLEPKSQVRLIFHGPAEWSRERQHEMRTLSQVLTLRLRDVLREELGATYGVGVNGSLSLRPDEEYRTQISFGCSPEEVENLIAVVFTEIDKLARAGVEASYLEKVKEATRRQRELSLEQNRFWLGALESAYIYDHDPRVILEFERYADAVTMGRVQEAARRYLDRERYVLAVLYPEEAAPAEG